MGSAWHPRQAGKSAHHAP
jgi:predicted Rossmann-fold nucleotide-binding protein